MHEPRAHAGAWVVGLALFCALSSVAPTPAHADYYDGLEAYREGDFAAALAEWLPLARAGDAEASYRVATVYDGEAGSGLNDPAQAARWFRAAAEQGHRLAQTRLGRLYAAGRGVEPDGALAERWLRKAANQGVAAAQYELALLLGAGRGQDADPVEALRWFRAAADQGHRESRFRLGQAYETGRGIATSDERALRWYRRAAKQGHGGAQLRVGAMLDAGRGDERDPERAATWYGRAAETGVVAARRNLASMHLQGDGVPLDYDRALFWLEPLEPGAATAPGDVRYLRDELAARVTPAVIRERSGLDESRTVAHEIARDDDDASHGEVITRAVAEGAAVAEAGRIGETSSAAVTPDPPGEIPDAEALYRRGRSHALGDAAPRNDEAAERALQQAAMAGHGMAAYRLGFLHYRGQNSAGRRDPVEAWAWLSLAAERDVGDAAEWRDHIAARLTAEELAEADARLRDLGSAGAD